MASPAAASARLQKKGESPVPPVLGRRPSARTYSIEELMQFVQDGKVRVPDFQRTFKWSGDDARKLLDSILRGYPIGTLLFWKKSGPAGTVTIGYVHVPAREVSDALWVVDGQQRIWSLTAALLAEPNDAGEFAAMFDLDTQVFLHPRSPGVAGRVLLPLTEVLDSQRLMEWLLERGEKLTPDQRTRALALGKAVREYQVPGYEVESDDDGALRQIFKRLNFYGKRIEENEVFDALHGARGTEPSTLRALAEEIASGGFGRPDEKILLRAAKAIAGVDLTKEVPESSVESDLLQRTTRAVRDVVVFFERDVNIPRYELVPYKAPFVTLSRFFDLHPEPRARSRELLARWVWRGAVSGLHRGDTTAIRKVLDAIDEDEEASVQRLLQQVDQQQGFESGQVFNFRHASSKLEVLALLDLKPRDLESRELVAVRRLFDEAPPGKPPIEQMIDNGAEVARTVANRMVHPHPRRPLRVLLREAGEPSLRSHGIAGEAVEALQRGDLTGVVSARADLLAERVERFLARRMRWEETDRPTLDALRVTDDE